MSVATVRLTSPKPHALKGSSMSNNYFFVAASYPMTVADDGLIINVNEVLVKFPLDWQAVLAKHGIERGFWTAEYGGEEADTLAFEGTQSQADALSAFFRANNAPALKVRIMDWTPETVRPMGEIIAFTWEKAMIKI